MSRFHHFFIEPSNFDASVRFYSETMGWRVAASWGGEGAPKGVHLHNANGLICVLAETHGAMGDHAKEGGMVGTRPTLHLWVENLAAAYEALPEGTVIRVSPEETHWGTQWFVVADPDGNLFAFESESVE